MDPSSENPRCAALADDLSALAVGALTGRERAEVLAHLEVCPACSAELDSLSGAFDTLVTLLPEAEPPKGFSERVGALARADHRVPRRPARREVRRPVAMVAALVTLGLGIGLGIVIASPSGHPPTTVTAALTSRSGAWGSVLIAPGQRSWIIMKLDDADVQGPVTCTVTMADGSRHTVGRFDLDSGYGTWAAELPLSTSQVKAVTVRDREGKTVATARLGD